MSFKSVTHVIFDLDGLLLDTEKFNHIAFEGIAKKYNKVLTEEIKRSVLGRVEKDTCSIMVESLQLPISPEEYKEQYHTIVNAMLPESKFMPDSEKFYQSAYERIAKKYNKLITHEIQLSVLGRIEKDIFKIMVEDLGLPISLKEYEDEYRKILCTMLPDSKFMPGAEKLVRHLHQHQIPIAIATSSAKDSVDLKMKNHQDILKMFNHVVMGSSDPEVKNGKPAPDIFLIAAQRFSNKPPPEKCLVLEDAPNGVQGAITAGMQCVMVPDPHTPVEARKKATLVLNSLNEFKPELFGLPAISKCNC